MHYNTCIYSYYLLNSILILNYLLDCIYFAAGAQKNGVSGFFKGVGKGVTGVLLKPTGGVFDSVSVLLDGFRRATQMDSQAVERVRLPRHAIPSEVGPPSNPYGWPG